MSAASMVLVVVLDLDVGTVAVWENDERLGVMATNLSGEFCWAVGLESGDSVPTESMPDPEAAAEPNDAA